MVAKIFAQMPNVDYHETTSPTPASTPVKIRAVAGNELDLPVFHLNVSQAFVQAPLQEWIYMYLPPGCGKLSGKIVRLLKCQYGMEQAGRVWHLFLVKWSVEMMRMEQCKAKPCIFRKMGMASLMVGVHVDDSIVSGESDVCYESFSDLKQRIPMEHLVELKIYTGYPFERDWENGILDIYQKAFAENMMTQYGITTVSNISARNGVDLGPRAEGETGGNEEFGDYHAFCVESPILMSVMTRQDIVNALRPCARHSHTPTVRHWKALLQKVAYDVDATKEIGLSFVHGSGLKRSVFAGLL